MQSVSIADCFFFQRDCTSRSWEVRKREAWLVVAKAERSLDGDEDEAVELFGLRLIVPDHWEAVGNDGGRLES